jgi:hypothetical protein
MRERIEVYIYYNSIGEIDYIIIHGKFTSSSVVALLCSNQASEFNTLE